MKEKISSSQAVKDTPIKIERNLGLFANQAQIETAQATNVNNKTDNISLAILRGLQKVGTKGLFKKIVGWAELNYREEVVSSIMTEFGLRTRNKNKFRGGVNKPHQTNEDQEDSENDDDIINNMKNAIEEESTDQYCNREERVKNLFEEGNFN